MYTASHLRHEISKLVPRVTVKYTQKKGGVTNRYGEICVSLILYLITKSFQQFEIGMSKLN